MKFSIHKKDGCARTGQLVLGALANPPKGGQASERVIETPGFMPVGTQATVKGVLPENLWETGTRMILCNTYHLLGRPGEVRVAKLGGLHHFMNWPGGVITDSGGFQVYSLSKIRSVDDNGVTFQHHLDGTSLRLEPERTLEIQRLLGSDIAMVLDECVALPAERDTVAKAMQRTLNWAARSRRVWEDWQAVGSVNKDLSHIPQVFGICQGGTEIDLRIECAQALGRMNFPGYALGGFAVGEAKEISYHVVEQTAPHLPEAKPRYLMGVGTPEELLHYIGCGVDLFDCVLPTRNARNGQLYTRRGKIVINHAKYADDSEPIEAECPCIACRFYSRGYLRHLYMAKEILAAVLNTLHNLTYFQTLMSEVRAAIAAGRYSAFTKEFLELQKSAESA